MHQDSVQREALRARPLTVIRSDRTRDNHRKFRREILYVSLDGLLAPKGASQVVAYVVGLARRGRRLVVVSFERPRDLADRVARKRLKDDLERAGVEWHAVGLRHRAPFARQLPGLLKGQLLITSLARRYRPEVIHARSYVAATLSLIAKPYCGRLLFDVRGFWPEDRVETNRARSGGASYRLSKRLERVLFDRADDIVVPTWPAQEIVEGRLQQGRSCDPSSVRVSVVPGAADLERFSPERNNSHLLRTHGLQGRVLIGNVGAADNRYLLHEMFRFTRFLKDLHPRLSFVYVTLDSPERVIPAAVEAGLGKGDVRVVAAEPDELPQWIAALSLGIFFLRPSHAAKAACLAKMGELLASGVPIVSNKGVGDIDRLVTNEGGLVLDGLKDSDLRTAARRAQKLLGAPRDVQRRDCRRIADEHLSLAGALDTYERIYDRSREGEADAAPGGAGEHVA